MSEALRPLPHDQQLPRTNGHDWPSSLGTLPHKRHLERVSTDLSCNSGKWNYQWISTENMWNPLPSTPWPTEKKLIVLHWLHCAMAPTQNKLTRRCSVRPLLPLVWWLHRGSSDVATWILHVFLTCTKKIACRSCGKGLRLPKKLDLRRKVSAMLASMSNVLHQRTLVYSASHHRTRVLLSANQILESPENL